VVIFILLGYDPKHAIGLILGYDPKYAVDLYRGILALGWGYLLMHKMMSLEMPSFRIWLVILTIFAAVPFIGLFVLNYVIPLFSKVGL
jgi:hypothetical protein